MKVNIIVAIAEDNGIGKDNQLLWHLPEDLKYFKSCTLEKTVIMGYKTYLSLDCKPLPKRRNIVISQYPFEAPGFEVVSSLQEAYKLVENEEDCFVIGGGLTYAEAMESADFLYITHIKAKVEGTDTFFPKINPSIWQEKSHSEIHYDSRANVEFQFVVYERKL